MYFLLLVLIAFLLVYFQTWLLIPVPAQCRVISKKVPNHERTASIKEFKLGSFGFMKIYWLAHFLRNLTLTLAPLCNKQGLESRTESIKLTSKTAIIVFLLPVRGRIVQRFVRYYGIVAKEFFTISLHLRMKCCMVHSGCLEWWNPVPRKASYVMTSFTLAIVSCGFRWFFFIFFAVISPTGLSNFLVF